MANEITNKIPSLSGLLLSGALVSLLAGGCDACETKKKDTATVPATTQGAEKGDASEDSDDEAGAEKKPKDSVRFNKLAAEEQRALLEALSVVLAESPTLETFKASPVLFPQHEVDNADSAQLKNILKAVTDSFARNPYAPETSLNRLRGVTFDKKKASTAKALCEIARAYELPCEVARGIVYDMLQSKDFSVLDKASELVEYEENTLGLREGQNALRSDRTFAPSLAGKAGEKGFATPTALLKLFKVALGDMFKASGTNTLSPSLGQVVVNSGKGKAAFSKVSGNNVTPTPKTAGARGRAWDSSWATSKLGGYSLPAVDDLIDPPVSGSGAAATGGNQDTFGIHKTLRFDQAFTTLFTGEAPADCMVLEVGPDPNTPTKQVVKKFEVKPGRMMHILGEARKDAASFAQFLGAHTASNDVLQDIFPTIDAGSYGDLTAKLETMLVSEDQLAADDVAQVMESIRTLLGAGSVISATTDLSAAAYDTATGYSAGTTGFASATKRVAYDVLGALKTKVTGYFTSGSFAPGAETAKAFAKSVNGVIAAAEGKFLVKKVGAAKYEPTALTKRLQKQIQAMDEAISAHKSGKVVTYRNIEDQANGFYVIRVHRALQAAVADLRLYLQLPSTLQGVLSMKGGKGEVNYAQVLNMPGLSKHQIGRLDDIRMSYQQKANEQPQPAAAG